MSFRRLVVTAPWLLVCCTGSSGGDTSSDASSPIDSGGNAVSDASERDDAGRLVTRDAGDGASPRTDAGPSTPPGPPGGPGCGLDSAAFCEYFETRATRLGRAGELDPLRWSGAHGSPQLPTYAERAIPVGPATIGACRDGLPARVFPNQDTLVCEPTAAIGTRHMLAAVGAQNYGQNSYRIRQPFDFTGRTGRIVFDAEARTEGALLGWISLAVTEDPEPIPNFTVGPMLQNNDEGASVPRSAVEIHFQSACPEPSQFAMRFIDVLDDYKDTVHVPDPPAPCLAGKPEHLNHVEVTISKSRIEVYASPYSEDGITFPPLQLMQAVDVDLPFERGYVQLTTHNHATIKYSPNNAMDSWVARWDNVGFDGPVVSGYREYEVPDSLTETVDAEAVKGRVVNVGYKVPEKSMGTRSFTLAGVDPSGATRASIAFSAWYLFGGSDDFRNYIVHYRVNGHTWHDRRFAPGELDLIEFGHSQGQFSHVVDVPVGELVAGDNTLEFATENIPTNYPFTVFNIDLVLAL